MSNIVHLPRSVQLRPQSPRFAFFIRVGRNDHLEMLDLIATGEKGIFGFVIEAQNIERHRILMNAARERHYDLILDPNTQRMGFPGGNTGKLATLPWGSVRHHNVTDFDDRPGRIRAKQIVDTALTHGFTHLLGPTHLLNGPNDPWLRPDISTMNFAWEEISRENHELGLIYSLALPMDIFRRRPERLALIAAIGDAQCDAIWLKIENFGDDATGEKTAAYIEACRDFHERGIPLVGDCVGGLPGLGAVAFGAIGGIAHGVTIHQNFHASNWRRPPVPSTGGISWRVYIPQLDLLMKPTAAKTLFEASPRIRARCGCRDTRCCPQGTRDMIRRPARHAIYQRARELEGLSETPDSSRVSRYLDERVRRVSDEITMIANVEGLDDDLRKAFLKKQRELGRFRHAMAHLSEVAPPDSLAISPPRRSATGH